MFFWAHGLWIVPAQPHCSVDLPSLQEVLLCIYHGITKQLGLEEVFAVWEFLGLIILRNLYQIQGPLLLAIHPSTLHHNQPQLSSHHRRHHHHQHHHHQNHHHHHRHDDDDDDDNDDDDNDDDHDGLTLLLWISYTDIMPRRCARCFRVATLVAPRGRVQGPRCTASHLEPPAAAAAAAAGARASAAPGAAPGASHGYSHAPGWLSADVAGVGWKKKAWLSRHWNLLSKSWGLIPISHFFPLGKGWVSMVLSCFIHCEVLGHPWASPIFGRTHGRGCSNKQGRSVPPEWGRF